MSEIIPTYIEDEMKRSYIDYAMSVIVGRALPDVRDGLKPVHRRILYAMKELGLVHNRAFRKSAAVVGEVLGKYHPHGDTSVYDTLVRMVQSFTLRYPLAMGQGNFGSIDGDAAAAYRYTEAKLSEIAELMLKDIEKEVVQMVANFDGRLKEPAILPSEFPNLLVNGSAGIAVGMATNIPPHNLTEIIDGLIGLMDNPEIEDFSNWIKGPDFPTAGVIEGTEGIKEAYMTGRGKIILKAQVKVEEIKNGRERICVSELPYQVNKSLLIAEIAELVKHKKIDGISDIRDESDREGMRIVIELKSNAPSQVIINRLFKHTALKTTYGIIMLVLKDGSPKVVGLKELMVSFLDYRYLIVKKRTEYELRIANERAHLLEGLKIAIANIDEVVKIIKTATNEDMAKKELINKFILSERQVKAILDMRLARLVGLEQEKIENEYKETIKSIKRFNEILASHECIMEVVREELKLIKEKFGDKRRTRITERKEELGDEDLIPDVPALVVLTQKGYLKRSKPGVYTRQHRGGKGVMGISLAPEDEAIRMIETSTLSTLVFFTNSGRCFSIKAYEIPEVERNARGKVVTNFISLAEGEEVKDILPIMNPTNPMNFTNSTNSLPLPFKAQTSVIIVTKRGIIKKLEPYKFDKIRNSGIIAITLKQGDELLGATEMQTNDYIMIITKKGKVIRFEEKKLRSLSRTAAGVKGIKLATNDEVIGIKTTCDPKIALFVITSNGYSKRVPVKSFRLTNRGGVGVVGNKVGIACCELVKGSDTTDEVIIVTKKGHTLRTSCSSIRRMGRSARGVKIVNLKGGDEIANVCRIRG
ncbi:MAG: DNA gyrase subunit A [Candidatus Stahlbacteria bacterium]|nr:DNA gyrase subunit A [Candidatus Stahlbacteria bacterium]